MSLHLAQSRSTWSLLSIQNTSPNTLTPSREPVGVWMVDLYSFSKLLWGVCQLLEQGLCLHFKKCPSPPGPVVGTHRTSGLSLELGDVREDFLGEAALSCRI